MNKTNFGLTIKNKALLGCGDFNHTYSIDNTGKRKSAFTANLEANVSKTAHISTINLSHHLTGEVIVKNDVKVQPQTEDMLQPPTADEQHVNNVNIRQHIHSVIMPFTPTGGIRIRRKGLSTFQHSPMTKVKYLQTFTQVEEVPKTDKTLAFLSNLEVKPYHFGEYQVDKILTFANITQCVKLKLNSLLRKFRSASRARSCCETPLKTQKIIAKGRSNNYANHALSKISKLALVGYLTKGAYSPLRAFFMRNISMRSHVMVKLERDIFICAGFLLYLSTNPFQLCHPYLVVNGKAPNQTKGVHTHV